MGESDLYILTDPASPGPDPGTLDVDTINKALKLIKTARPQIKPSMAWLMREWTHKRLWAVTLGGWVKNIPVLRNIFWEYRSAYLMFARPDFKEHGNVD